MIKIEHNVETGEITEIELTAAEIKEIKTNAAKAQSDQAIKVANKAAAQAKLSALGLTTDDLKALGLGGN